MKKLSLLITASSTILLAKSGVNTQENPGTWSPVDIIGCNFINGAGMDDFDRAIDSWNDSMDQNGHNFFVALKSC